MQYAQALEALNSGSAMSSAEVVAALGAEHATDPSVAESGLDPASGIHPGRQVDLG